MNKTTIYNHKKKDKIIYIMGGKCCVCGYNRLNAALEMHHIDMADKEFSFSNYSHYKSIMEMKNEMEKCALVCSVCHKEIHYGDFNITVKSTFDINKFNEVVLEIENSKKKIKTATNYCRNCGKEIDYRATLCRNCFSEKNQKVTRPSRTEFKKLIRNHSFSEIAKIYNVSDKAIAKWCLSYNLPSKKTDINKLSDVEWKNL